MNSFLTGFADELVKLAAGPSPYVVPQTASGPGRAPRPSEFVGSDTGGRGSASYGRAINKQVMESPPIQKQQAWHPTTGPKVQSLITQPTPTPQGGGPKGKGQGGGKPSGEPAWELPGQRIARIQKENAYNRSRAGNTSAVGRTQAHWGNTQSGGQPPKTSPTTAPAPSVPVSAQGIPSSSPTSADSVDADWKSDQAYSPVPKPSPMVPINQGRTNEM